MITLRPRRSCNDTSSPVSDDRVKSGAASPGDRRFSLTAALLRAVRARARSRAIYKWVAGYPSRAAAGDVPPAPYDEENTVAQADPKLEQRPPAVIEDDMEATRQRLAGTIDQLVHRASPKTIARREVEGIRAHFIDAQGNPRTDNILKVAGAVVGFMVFVVVIRKVTR